MPFLKDDDETPPGETDTLAPLLPSPGRDPSRLMQDIAEHAFEDPQIHSNPPPFDPTKPHKSQEPAHTHSWIMKSWDSLTARPWNVHAGGSAIVALCETCRMHLSLTAIITTEMPLCTASDTDTKSHHYHIESWTKNTRYSAKSTPVERKPEYGTFQCCQCPLAIHIEFWSPVVPEYLLSSFKKRKTGTNSALNIISRNKDSNSILATNAYATLAKYVTHVLNASTKPIGTFSDSPFDRRFGRESDALRFMEYLGWVRDDESLQPPEWDEELDRGRLRRKLLERAELELTELAIESGKDVSRSDKETFHPNVIRAESEIANLLGAIWPRPGYDFRSQAYFRKSIVLDGSLNPSYACLGTVPDATEAIIIHAYQKQVEDDPIRIVFYLECLQDIGSSIQSRTINQFAEKEVANGIFTRFELQRAYKILEVDHPDEIDDDGVLAVFHSRCIDVPERENDFFHALKVIQYYRKSDVIGETAASKSNEKREMTPGEAYKTLLIQDQFVTDDSVIAHFVSCNADYPDEREKFTEALQVVGKERNSLSIRTFLSGQNESQVAVGPLNQQMSLEESFIVLGLEGGAKEDDGAVMTAFNELIAVQPDRTEEFKKAVETIADHRDSIPLKTFLIDMIATPERQQPGAGSADRPVGLENIAQTCYMNSLFQYYFSLKPLRNAILSYENHQEGDLSEEELKKKQISKWELERSKRFIAQLRLLFQDLITSDHSYIRPKEELIRLTLVDAKQEIEDEAIKRRQSLQTNASHSILDSDIPDLIEIADTSVPCAPVSSPVRMASPVDMIPEIETPVRKTAKELAKIQISSQPEDMDGFEFVERDEGNELTNGMLSMAANPMSLDKENVPESASTASKTSEEKGEKKPLQESQQVNVQATEVEDTDDVEMLDFGGAFTPPVTPPPIPARPPQRRKSTWGVMKYGSQQDVTECITNCLSQLHAAFKPEEEDSTGGQIDLFKRLFYIRVKQAFRDLQAGPSAKPIDEKEELYGSMLPVYIDPEIGGSLYDAIDRALGRERIEYRGVEDCEKSTTVTYLPPVLQIQIVRAQFNRSVGAGYKENTHLELESKIYMDRYMDSTDPDFNTRQDDYWKWKMELESAQRKKAEILRKSELPLNPLELLSMARGFLEKFSSSGIDESVPTELLDGLSLYENNLRKQVEKLDKDADNLKSRLKQQFTDRRQYGYRLHSVFIHRGDVAHGHYWIYIYDFAGNRWFKYNDEQVTEVDEQVVFANDSAEGAGPYFVTYVKEDAASDLVEALKRDLSGNLMSFVE